MEKSTMLLGAALAALALGGCTKGTRGEQAANPKGECWGVNACKGQGECGGTSHSCAGENACKGKGWIGLTKAECDARGGEFKGG